MAAEIQLCARNTASANNYKLRYFLWTAANPRERKHYSPRAPHWSVIDYQCWGHPSCAQADVCRPLRCLVRI